MRVLVTGAGGSVGRQVCRELLHSGHSLVACDIPKVDLGELAGRAETAVGDVRDAAFVRRATEDVDAVVHLAALLPPASERDRAFAMAVNYDGTRHVLDGLRAAGRGAQLVFASSVCTYGDTSGEQPPVRVDHPLRPRDLYAESKIRCEAAIRGQAEVPWTILRVAGIAVPAFLEPPAVWPFRADQRIEFVNRDDVAYAMAGCVGNAAVAGRAINIAGGPTWQMMGHEYVQAHFDLYGVDPEEARYQEEAGWLDWYDSTEGASLLAYQRTTFGDYLALLEKAIQDAVGC